MMLKKLLLTTALLLLAPGVLHAEALLFQGTEATGNASYDFLEATPDGKFLYAINEAATSVESFSIASDGRLQAALPSTTLPNLAGTQSFTFSPDADFILLGNDSGNAIGGRAGLYAFSRGTTQGFVAAEFYLAGATTPTTDLFDHINVKGVAVTPDRKNIYVVGQRIAGTGLDTDEGLVGIISDVTYTASTNRIDYAELTVVANRQVEQNDAVTPASSVADLDAPVGVVATDESVYVISDSTTDAFLHFSRDAAAEGALTFKSSVTTATGASDLQNPKDMLLLGSGSSTQIFVAASTASTGAIVQFEHSVASLSPVLKQVYSATGEPEIEGLVGVAKLLSSSTGGGVVYAASPTAQRITPFYLDEGELLPIQNDKAITEGAATTSGGNISGLAGVDLLAVGNAREHLYADSSVSATTGLARFSRQSDLSVVVSNSNRRVIQPGQLAGFVVTATNTGLTDAPGFVMNLSPSHAVSAITGTDSASCTTTSQASSVSIACEKELLEKDEVFTVNVVMSPRSVTTASLRATAFSRNEISGINTAVTDSAEVKVGEFKNGTLSMGVFMYMILLSFYYLRRKKYYQS